MNYISYEYEEFKSINKKIDELEYMINYLSFETCSIMYNDGEFIEIRIGDKDGKLIFKAFQGVFARCRSVLNKYLKQNNNGHIEGIVGLDCIKDIYNAINEYRLVLLEKCRYCNVEDSEYYEIYKPEYDNLYATYRRWAYYEYRLRKFLEENDAKKEGGVDEFYVYSR